MKGKIKAKGKCPKCHKRFVHIYGVKYTCPEHETGPNRFYIDLGWNGRRVKIFSDKQGNPLSSYHQTLNIHGKIQVEIENHTFDPTFYVTADLKKFAFDYRIKKWIQEKDAQVRKGNLADSYVSKLKIYQEKYIVPWFKGRDVREIRKLDIKEFYRDLPDRLAPKYAKNIMDGLENFFNGLLDDGAIERKPVFPDISIPEPQVKWCSRETQDKILNAIPEKHRPIFFFLTRQGLRVGEGAAAKWKDIDLQGGTITPQRTYSNRKIVERTKGKTIRTRLLHPDVLEILRSLPRGLPEVFLFLNPNNRKPYQNYTLERIWKEACQMANVDIGLYEATRHSVASMAASSGVSINIIKEVMGHTDIRTTMKYAHLNVLAQGQVFAAQERHQKGTEPKNDVTNIIKFNKLPRP